MTSDRLDWTHKDVEIVDIRKINKFYIIKINDNVITSPLFVKISIFDERMKSYFLKDVNDVYTVTREEVFKLKWNLYISKGHYIKIGENGSVIQYDQDANKYYVSFIEISGPLGSFLSVYKEKHE